MTEKARAVLDDLVRRITADTVSRYVRRRLFSDAVDIPCLKWSRLNRFMTVLAGTDDARGIRQWNAAGRRVKKGARGFHILVPLLHSKKKKDSDEDELILTGFRAMPVFRVEDTEGAPLDYELTLKAFDARSLPLIEVADSLGVSVKAGLTGSAEGFYSPSRKQITMGTDDPQAFLHELSHAVDCALPNRNTDYAFGEAVAELSSAFLGSLYEVPVDIANTAAYIRNYTGKGHAAFKAMDALQRVEEIYRYIETAGAAPGKPSRKTAKTGSLTLEQRPKPPEKKAAGADDLFSGKRRSRTAKPKPETGLFAEQESRRIIEFPEALRKEI